MPAYSNAPPGISPEMWAQITGNYNQAEQDPEWRAEMQRNQLGNSALRAAQTASMGMLQSGPMSSGVADPADAFARFSASGYSGEDALRDGWLTGTGVPGWERTSGYQAEPTGMLGGLQAAPSAPRTSARDLPSDVMPFLRPQRPPQTTQQRPTYGAGPNTQPGGNAPTPAPGNTPVTPPPAPSTPAHWDMGDYGASGSWSNGYNPHWIGSDPTPQPAAQPSGGTSTGTSTQPAATTPSGTPQPAAVGSSGPGGWQGAQGGMRAMYGPPGVAQGPHGPSGGPRPGRGGNQSKFDPGDAMKNIYGGG